MNLNIFDIGIFLILIMFIIAGWKNGVVKEAASFIGIIIVFFLSYLLKDIVGNILCTLLPFFKLGGLISLNILIYQSIAFILLFSLLLCLYRLLLKVSNTLQKIVNATIILILPSKVLGAIISFIEGWIILFIILVALVVPCRNRDSFRDSTMSNTILFNTPVLSNVTKPFTNAVVEIYTISNKITLKKTSINEANLETIDIMLKYKLVDKNTVKKLIEIHKLDSIQGLDEIINNY